MFHVLGKIPKETFYVACSGGPDSMFLIDYLKRWPKNKFEILHFNHGTKYCDEAEAFVTEFCINNNLKINIGKIHSKKKKDQSQEEFWREQRYNFLSLYSDKPILMAHHLNDVIETWIMTSMCGKPQIIPYYNKQYNIYRPFLCVPKTEINKWIEKNHLNYVVDGSNFDTNIKRNYVRHKMMEHIYHINPGIEKTISKIVLKNYEENYANGMDLSNAII